MLNTHTHSKKTKISRFWLQAILISYDKKEEKNTKISQRITFCVAHLCQMIRKPVEIAKQEKKRTTNDTIKRHYKLYQQPWSFWIIWAWVKLLSLDNALNRRFALRLRCFWLNAIAVFPSQIHTINSACKCLQTQRLHSLSFYFVFFHFLGLFLLALLVAHQ